MVVKKNEIQFSIVFLSLLAGLSLFCAKLVFIQVFQSDYLVALAEKQHNHVIEIEPLRGNIYDRRMRPLALNASVYSLFANPKLMDKDDKQITVEKLSVLLGLDPKFIQERLSRNKYFVWLKRKLPKETAEVISKMDIKGLDFIRESKRFYPNGEIAAHVVGFAGMDNTGLEGVEMVFDKYLKGKSGRARILRDAKQTDLLIEKGYIPARDGFHAVLTIDETIQYIAERALEEAVTKHDAESGTVIVMDVRTGEILAMANRPTYNLGNVAASSTESRTNRAVSYVYEPGSVFKVVTAAAALEEDVFVENDEIFCENGKYRIANHTLTDHRPHGKKTFREVFQVSSNIGVVKIAQKLGPDTIYKYGKRFQFGKPTGIELKGEVSGWLKSPSLWSKTTIGAIPIGYEVTVTPLQLISAISAVANDGIYMKPHVVKYIMDQNNRVIREFPPQVVDRVVSEQTAQRVRDILVGVVAEGTGRRARIKGVPVAGKTGTARKVMNGTYVQGKYYASFMGFAPADNPRIATLVVLDEPKPYYFGGTVSAPVFKEVVENSLNYLETAGRPQSAVALTRP